MADMTTREDRAKGMGIIGAGIGLGFIFGPPLGGIMSGYNLLSTFPFLSSIGTTIYSSSALVSVVVSLINFLMIIFLFEETFVLQNSPNKRGFSHPVFGIFSSDVVQLPKICLIYFLFTLGFSGFEFCINFFFYESLNFSPKEIGYSFVYMGSIVILIQGGVIRRISGKVAEKKIAIFGSISLLIGFVIISLSKSLLIVFLALSFLSIGSAFLNPGISSLASIYSSQDEQGKNLGIMRGFGSLARAFAPLIFSLIYFTKGPVTTFRFSFIVIFVVLILLLNFKEERKN
jgi:MFS family permease